MKVRLNLSTKPLQSHRQFLAASGLLALVAGVIFIVLGWHVYRVRRSAAELRARSQSTRAQLATLVNDRASLQKFFEQKENADLNSRAAYLNGIIDARSFNWTQMFMDLEHVLPGGVHVVSVEPKQDKGAVEVKLVVGAASDQAKLKFLRSLEESPVFRQVILISEHAPTGSSAGDQTILELTTVYSRT
jgi:type IV pilus assembly protein PilN